jgi:hypothetical protein
MLCYEDYHINHENRNYKISLLCLLPFHQVKWNNFLRNFNKQQKSILYPKENHQNKRRASCRELFKKFNILPLVSKFLPSLSSFVVDNIEKFQTNPNIHNINTRYRYNLHVSNTNLSKYQKGVYYSGIKLFNNLPPTIKSLNHDIKKFKPALKEYLLSHSFYSVEKFTSTKNSQLL